MPSQGELPLERFHPQGVVLLTQQNRERKQEAWKPGLLPRRGSTTQPRASASAALGKSRSCWTFHPERVRQKACLCATLSGWIGRAFCGPRAALAFALGSVVYPLRGEAVKGGRATRPCRRGVTALRAGGWPPRPLARRPPPSRRRRQKAEGRRQKAEGRRTIQESCLRALLMHVSRIAVNWFASSCRSARCWAATAPASTSSSSPYGVSSRSCKLI